ncbi:hypothetical protein A6A03_18495 [Chloroflexus islandicus]|uniref:Uncharacterized protein n=1 Tax=Chloroflexus islandicus TaxID=1707952 RepID=A0A178M6T9_9CHLR|nr:hypothetical protein A6A03_18495 [Chloroflexus islandicus]
MGAIITSARDGPHVIASRAERGEAISRVSASDSSTHSAGMSSLNHAGEQCARHVVIASRAERGEAISRVSENDGLHVSAPFWTTAV